MSEPARAVTPLVPNDAPRAARLLKLFNREDRELFQVLAMLIATPWLCLAIATWGSVAADLVMSLFDPLAR